jgi:NADH-quinone oxidoreductase subunit G
LVRHAKPLQTTQTLMEGEVDVVRLHPHTAKALGIKDGDRVTAKQKDQKEQKESSASLIAKLDPRIAEGAAWIAGGIPATENLGDLFGEVSLEPC